ncbi:MAG TPA: chromosomal replication initiator protein DnaA [Candidatus Acidoferrales bacterium]|nr:chromosomal replication initiator protein DnaA [Candidatus Acidoferrales bacterium]
MAVQPELPEEQTRLWEQVLLSVKSRLGSHQAFDTWFRPIVALELSPHAVDLEVPNAFFVDWIHEHHLAALRGALHEVMRAHPDIRFSPREPAALPPAPAPAPAPLPEARASVSPAAPSPGGRLWLESQLNPRLTFDSFVVGGSNRFTQAACLAVSEQPGSVYNPLFIFGGSGLGKTHLLHAVGHAVKKARPESRVHYVPAERFTNEMIFAIQHGQTLAFRNKYRNVDVLLIDDVQFLAGKESTQEEFFYTFNALRDCHRQIVVTADKAPKDIEGLEERLISRFNQGLIADIKQPDLETRIAILRNRCALEGAGTRLQDDVLLLLADRIRGNVRDLEGCLVRLLAVASLTHQDITLDLAEEVLTQYVGTEPDHLTPERILGAVSERFGVKTDALLGQRRTAVVALPRQVAMYLMRQLTDLSLAEIGRFCGGRDHTTVLYACDKIGGRINAEESFRDKVNLLISTLASG